MEGLEPPCLLRTDFTDRRANQLLNTHSSSVYSRSSTIFSCFLLSVSSPPRDSDGVRTHDPLIKSEMLYQLSYEVWSNFMEFLSHSKGI